jgi:hypothetical protein
MDFLRPETYVDTAEDQRDGFYRYSASIYEEDNKSTTGSLILRPSPSNEESSGEFVVCFFPHSFEVSPPH